MDADAKVTATEAAHLLNVDRSVVYMWRRRGLLQPVDKRGRSPLYRLGDVYRVESETRLSGFSHRSVSV